MEVKSMGLTHKLLSKLLVLSDGEAGGIPCVAVKCVDKMCIRDSSFGSGIFSLVADG